MASSAISSGPSFLPMAFPGDSEHSAHQCGSVEIYPAIGGHSIGDAEGLIDQIPMHTGYPYPFLPRLSSNKAASPSSQNSEHQQLDDAGGKNACHEQQAPDKKLLRDVDMAWVHHHCIPLIAVAATSAGKK